LLGSPVLRGAGGLVSVQIELAALLGKYSQDLTNVNFVSVQIELAALLGCVVKDIKETQEFPSSSNWLPCQANQIGLFGLSLVSVQFKLAALSGSCGRVCSLCYVSVQFSWLPCQAKKNY